MEGRLFLDHDTLALETRLLLSEATLEHGIRGEDDVVLLHFFGVSYTRSAMPYKYVHPGCMRFYLIAPLHNRNCWTVCQVRSECP